MAVALVAAMCLAGCNADTSEPTPGRYAPSPSRAPSASPSPTTVSIPAASQERGADPTKSRICEGFCSREAGRAAADLCSGSARGNLNADECLSAAGRAGYNECMRGCMGL